MAKPMLSLGVPGLVYQIPMPQSGMGFNSEHDITKVATVHGGKSIVSSPTTHKSFTLSWKDWDDNLRALIDAHGGTIGNTAFWLQDPTADQNNLLPARWSNAWQLGYIAGGWCKPVIQTGSTGPQSRVVTFTQVNAATSATKLSGVVRNRTLRLAGTAMYLSAVGGSRTLLAVPSISLGATTALAAPSPSLGAATPLASPTLNAPTASASGGSLAAATYYYQVVATNVAGQTLPSNEVSVTTTGSNSSVALSWNQVNGASAYIVYRGTSAGGENVEVANPQGGTTTSYTDTGAVPVASPSFTPTSNTTGSGSFAAGTYYWKVTAVNGSGETTGSAELTATLGANGSQQITWPAIAGATKYNVYRGTAAGAENTLAGSVTATAAATYSFQDTGTSNTAGTVPSSNTTPDGSFTAGTYYWKVTAVNQYGETPASNEVSVTLAVNGSQTITWPAVTGATGYKVYRGTAAGAENVLLTTTNSTTYSYKDTGVAAPAGSPPASDTGTGSGIIVRTFSSATNTWTQVGVYDPATLATPTQVVASTDTTTTFVEIDLFLPAGTQMTLRNLSLGTVAWTGAFPNGTGVGACQFDGALQGTLQFGGNPTSNWIGMAVNISEVERGDGVIRFG